MKLWVRSNFSISVLFLVGALAFALVSIDRAKIQSVAIIGELSESQILSVKDRLLVIDIEAEQEFIRDKLLALEWIDQVNIRRQWPNTIGVEIVPDLHRHLELHRGLVRRRPVGRARGLEHRVRALRAALAQLADGHGRGRGCDRGAAAISTRAAA